MKKIFLFFLISFNPLLIFGEDSNSASLLAGAGNMKITPDVETFSDSNKNGRYDEGEPFNDLNHNKKWDPVWLAGNLKGRYAKGVHDDLWARSLIITLDQETILFVSLDLIGYLFDEVSLLKEEINKRWQFPKDHIFIASTHDHSGPDTIGLWGEGSSGKSPDYTDFLKRQILKSVEEALKNQRAAKIYFGKTHFSNPITDARPPNVINDLLLSLRAVDEQGNTIATVVNYALHAEVMNEENRLITSDYPGFLKEEFEKEFGGISLFFAGDVGGMQTPRVFFHTFSKCRSVGRSIAKRVIQSLKNKEQSSISKLSVSSKKILFPVENPRFLSAIKNGLFGNTGDFLIEKDGKSFLPSEVAWIQFGKAQFVTIPGELFPELGRLLKKQMNSEYPFLIGLCNNEIGYIVPTEEWNDRGYEEAMSLGRRTAEIILSEFSELFNFSP